MKSINNFVKTHFCELINSQNLEIHVNQLINE